MATTPVTLSSIVTDASTEAIKAQAPVSTEPVKTEATTTTETPKADEWTDDDLSNAKLVYKTLKEGGENAASFIDALATKNGYGKVETKQEAKELKADIKNELEEALGAEYGHLSKILTPALDKYINRKLEEGTAEINNTLRTSEKAKLEVKSEQVLVDLGKEYYEGKGIPDDVDQQMAKMMQKYTPSDGQDIEEYMTDIFHMTVAKMGKVPLASKSKVAAAAARNNTPAILDQTKGRPSPGIEAKPREKGVKMNVHDAVTAAVREVNEKMEKN